MTPARTRLLTRVGLALLGFGIGLGLAEAAVRFGRLVPVRQVIRGHGVRELNGIVVWDAETERHHLDCVRDHPERTRIEFFGNSITDGAGVASAQTFAWILEDRLNAERPTPGFCVMNFATPGYLFPQKYAVATELVPQYRPAIVFFQDWDNDWPGTECSDSGQEGDFGKQFRILGGDGFATAGLELRPDGFPGMRGVPDGLNQFLFLSSHFYQYVTLALGETPPPHRNCIPGADVTLRVRSLRKVAALASSVGALPVFYIAADLSYPMKEIRRKQVEYERPVLFLEATDGVRVFTLRSILTDQDNKVIGLDMGHFSVAGHAVLADRFERITLNILDGRPTTEDVLPTAAPPVPTP